jgi:uncharacterized delta-60 repeat protein
MRYLADGTLDTSFGDLGTAFSSFPISGAVAKRLKIQNNGKLIIGGLVMDSPPDGTSIYISRYNQDGSLDDTFGTGGITTTDIGLGSGLNGLDMLSDFVIQQNGKIVATGASGPNAVILRYNSDGTLDSSFGLNGIISQNFSETGNSIFNGVDVQGDGKVVAVGFATSETGFSDFLVTRYSTSGNLDVAFGNLGILVTPLSAEQDVAHDVIVQSDNKILVGGVLKNSIFRFAMTRYDSDGNPDITFGNNGIVETTIDSSFNYLSAIAIQSDGKILATGSVGANFSDVAVVRYSSSIVSIIDQLSAFENVSIFPIQLQIE